MKHIFACIGVTVIGFLTAVAVLHPDNSKYPILIAGISTGIGFLGLFYNSIVIRPLPRRLRIIPYTLLVIALTVGITIFIPYLIDVFHSIFPGQRSVAAKPVVTRCALSNGEMISIPSFPKGIGITHAKGGDYGISNGSVIFDTNRADVSLKRQAAEQMKKGNTSAATSLWAAAINADSTDAEAHVYEEDLR